MNNIFNEGRFKSSINRNIRGFVARVASTMMGKDNYLGVDFVTEGRG